MDSAVVAAGS